MRRTLTIALLPLLLLTGMLGCGTQQAPDLADQDSTGDTVSAPGLSTVRITLLWPQGEASASALPQNTTRVDLYVAGDTTVGPEEFLVPKSVTAADVVGGRATVEFSIPDGLGHVASAEAYDSNGALLAIGSSVIDFDARQNGTATIRTYLAGGAPIGAPTPGDVIVYQRASSYVLGATTSICAIDPDGENERVVSTPSGTDYFGPALSPGATRLIFSGASDEILQASLLAGSSYSVTQISPGSAGTDLAWSRTGDMIAFVRNDDIVISRPDGAVASNITNTPGTAERHPSFSPDGERICFHISEATTDYGDIGIVDTDAANYSMLTQDYLAGSTDWSPDGSEIAFDHMTNALTDDFGLYVVNVAGGEPVALALEEDSRWANVHPNYSHDGRKLVFVRQSNPTLSQTDVWVVERDDLTELAPLTETPDAPEALPDWR